MAGIFDGVYGAQFPDVVMNSGPLPSEGGLPAPLHDTPDARINYNSTLLGDLEPYAYGEPAYLSTQQSYLNIPHRIQKILPVIYLPEPKGHTTFRLSHSIDDGDIAFSLRLNKSSVFCTGSRTATRKNALGTAVEPFINLPTLNYILAGIQRISEHDLGNNNLWMDFLHALDSSRFPLQGKERDYQKNRLDLQDLIYVVRECIRPFGIMRGSEKQGGQNEMTESPATWPVPFVTTLVIDGREDHVVNMWHNMDVDAGEDLVLRFKPMPIPETYTLNHYYKQPMQKSFDRTPNHTLVWQLVPDKMSYNIDDSEYDFVTDMRMPEQYLLYKLPQRLIINGHKRNDPFRMINISALRIHWQELGYWHIGRTQIRLTKYITDDSSYYHNDMVNMLRSQYMLLTFEPVFQKLPLVVNKKIHEPEEYDTEDHGSNYQMMSEIENKSKLVLGKTQTLDSFFTDEAHDEEESEWTFVSTAAAPSSMVASTPAAADDKKTKRRKITSGAVIHPDGSTEAQTIQTL